jgi:spore coat protein CotF
MSDNQNVGGYSLLWNDETFIVECIKLEAVCNFPVDFLKMDIEGAELNIIENSKVLCNIKYLELEFHNNMPTIEYWYNYLAEYFPNHNIVYTTDDPIIRSVLLAIRN